MPRFSLLLLPNSSREVSRQEYPYLSFSCLSGTHLKAKGRVGLMDVIRTGADMMSDRDAPTFQPSPHREVRRITSSSDLMTCHMPPLRRNLQCHCGVRCKLLFLSLPREWALPTERAISPLVSWNEETWSRAFHELPRAWRGGWNKHWPVSTTTDAGCWGHQPSGLRKTSGMFSHITCPHTDSTTCPETTQGPSSECQKPAGRRLHLWLFLLSPDLCSTCKHLTEALFQSVCRNQT